MMEEARSLLEYPENLVDINDSTMPTLPYNTEPNQANTSEGFMSIFNPEGASCLQMLGDQEGDSDPHKKRELTGTVNCTVGQAPPTSTTPPATPKVLLGQGGRKQVVVLGSGDFGLALTGRLTRASYRVILASRNPNRTRERVSEVGGIISTYQWALGEEGSEGVVVVAVPPQHYQSLPLNLLNGKVLIDVSNRCSKPSDAGDWSHAETLQRLVPEGRVVKAFNMVSAYSLTNGGMGTTQIPVCGDDNGARSLVCEMVRDIGLDPVDYGPLVNARKVELMPLQFFPAWRSAFVTSVVVWSIFFFLTLFEWDLCDNLRNINERHIPFNWTVFNNVAKENVTRSCATTALTLLSACYLPGVLAGYLQLCRGTKYRQFPVWMASWLSCRKYLGLLMLFNALIHGMMEMNFNIPPSSSWHKPTCYASGVVSLALAGVLGITSLPSVASSLTWREFCLSQSRLGWFTLLLSTLHVIFIEWDNLIKPNFTCYIPSIGQLVMVVPIITVGLKLPLLLPCVDSHLTNIRQGYERKAAQHRV